MHITDVRVIPFVGSTPESTIDKRRTPRSAPVTIMRAGTLAQSGGGKSDFRHRHRVRCALLHGVRACSRSRCARSAPMEQARTQSRALSMGDQVIAGPIILVVVFALLIVEARRESRTPEWRVFLTVQRMRALDRTFRSLTAGLEQFKTEMMRTIRTVNRFVKAFNEAP